MNKWFRLLCVLVAVFSSTVALSEPLDINTANADQLAQTMVGIGKAKADAIVQDREKNGQFKSVDDLSRVKGVKSNLIEKNREKISAGPVAAPPVAGVASK
jgi:competence protein ComEA